MEAKARRVSGRGLARLALSSQEHRLDRRVDVTIEPGGPITLEQRSGGRTTRLQARPDDRFVLVPTRSGRPLARRDVVRCAIFRATDGGPTARVRAMLLDVPSVEYEALPAAEAAPSIEPGADVRTFSGTHGFRRRCLLEATLGELAAQREVYELEVDPADRRRAERLVDRLVAEIARGTCPRCKGPLPSHPPAGSRITLCRCVPVCGACGSHEATCRLPGHPYRVLSRRGIWSGPLEWVGRPADPDAGAIDAHRAWIGPAILDVRLERPLHEAPRPRLGGWADPDAVVERD